MSQMSKLPDEYRLHLSEVFTQSNWRPEHWQTRPMHCWIYYLYWDVSV